MPFCYEIWIHQLASVKVELEHCYLEICTFFAVGLAPVAVSPESGRLNKTANVFEQIWKLCLFIC